MNPRLALSPILCLILTGCFSSDRSDTVARAKSPSGTVEALLDENNGGATTSFGYVVSLRALSSSATTGVRVASAYGAVRSDQAYGMMLVWVDANTLEIQYWQARWATVERPMISIDGTTISIRMKAGVRDESAPAGGMFYNIQHRSAAERAN
jgi:hypothetical protein